MNGTWGSLFRFPTYGAGAAVSASAVNRCGKALGKVLPPPPLQLVREAKERGPAARGKFDVFKLVTHCIPAKLAMGFRWLLTWKVMDGRATAEAR